MAGAPGPDPERASDWVVGAGGLLGSAVCRRLRALGREPRTTVVPWEDHDAAVAVLVAAGGRSSAR